MSSESCLNIDGGSYDAALWATIADFPYSWPLWQRYAKKFVSTNLVSSVLRYMITMRSCQFCGVHRQARRKWLTLAAKIVRTVLEGVATTERIFGKAIFLIQLDLAIERGNPHGKFFMRLCCIRGTGFVASSVDCSTLVGVLSVVGYSCPPPRALSLHTL